MEETSEDVPEDAVTIEAGEAEPEEALEVEEAEPEEEEILEAGEAEPEEEEFLPLPVLLLLLQGFLPDVYKRQTLYYTT